MLLPACSDPAEGTAPEQGMGPGGTTGCFRRRRRRLGWHGWRGADAAATSVDKIDLLFMIDNSISMSDKQDILRRRCPIW